MPGNPSCSRLPSFTTLPVTVTGTPPTSYSASLPPQDNQKPISKADLQLHRDFIWYSWGAANFVWHDRQGEGKRKKRGEGNWGSWLHDSARSLFGHVRLWPRRNAKKIKEENLNKYARYPLNFTYFFASFELFSLSSSSLPVFLSYFSAFSTVLLRHIPSPLTRPGELVS